ncbi:nucleotidyltransferase domain-containing protein [Nocardia sp. NPDC088792]|uniref:nucleotidyltransferase domain-containing protein n=1 Tax=Nocardia sp. NPDC088792 TaxID=3364332 RepID=UPI003806E35A
MAEPSPRELLETHDLLPADPLAVVLVGSHARGWAHTGSDIDIMAVVEQPVTDPRAVPLEVSVRPDRIQAVIVHAGGPRLEIKYWLADQIDQVLDRVSWEAFEHRDTIEDGLDVQSRIMLERLMNGRPLHGDSWANSLSERIRSSAFRAFQVNSALAECDGRAESALGMLASGDADSAVLTAREAFGCAIDALLMAHGELNANRKWRARRFRELEPGSMSYAEYWDWETMRGLDPDAPGEWVRDVVRLCKNMWLDIDLQGV